MFGQPTGYQVPNALTNVDCVVANAFVEAGYNG
jgi:hypothetical protein